MKEFWNTIQLVFTAVGGWLGWFLGGCDGLLYALLIFVTLDYLTGVMCAVADHKLSSEVGWWASATCWIRRSSVPAASFARQSFSSISPMKASPW